MEMCFNKPFMSTKFQLNQSMSLHFMVENAKDEEECKEIKMKFCLLLS